MVHERVVDDFVRDIALYDPAIVDAHALESRAAELGLAPALPRTAVLLRVRETGRQETGVRDSGERGAGAASRPPARRLPVLRTIRGVFRGGQDVAGETATGRFTVLTATSGGQPALLRRCENLLGLLHERHGWRCTWLSANRARARRECTPPAVTRPRRCTSAPPSPRGERIFTITELRVPQLVASVSGTARHRYADSVLRELHHHADWPVLRATLIGWAEGGFSLLRAAERLHVHRNTLIYRLDKITRLSGTDVREPTRALAMYLACVTDLLDTPSGGS
ncbi:PucR family transcriptional regulator [Streptomyces albidus (ex Kaewkla and Franco 2022)]|uniref:PucR family transcriptional regulator n=1 Tax=Streptomyces albidus (ex Kaewkla and Franco 2022) TaxID=722709 RepID=UPI0022A67354|nr:helix-turn-helix domain-containing protein [Streptomyces albidus (ex Kaewkla and Franco 2022)]